MLAKNSRAMFEQQRVERGFHDWVGGDETCASTFGHRALILRQGIQQIGEGGPVGIHGAQGVAHEITYVACVL